MPLADAVGVVAAFGEHLGEQCGVGRDAPVAVRETVGEFFDGGHADGGGVAAGQQGRPGRRAQRGGVKLRQPHAALGDPRHGGHLDQAAEAVPGRDAGVVPDQIEDVRRVLRRGRRGVRTPVRLGIPDIQLDLAVEFSGHRQPHSRTLCAEPHARPREFSRMSRASTPQVGVATSSAKQNARDRMGPGRSLVLLRLLGLYFAFSRISTSRQRLVADIGRVSISETRSPMPAVLFSSCALTFLVVRMILPYSG